MLQRAVVGHTTPEWGDPQLMAKCGLIFFLPWSVDMLLQLAQ